jgi:HD superfamily phosphodiesterase
MPQPPSEFRGVTAIVKAKPATLKDAHDAIVNPIKEKVAAAKQAKKAEKEETEREEATPETVLGMLGRAIEQVKHKVPGFTPEDVAALEGHVNDLILLTMSAREAFAPAPEKVDA